MIRIGTSGWQYRHWRGTFYPEGLVQKYQLRYLAERLNSVEVNSSFYRLPTRATFAHWREETPADFVFSVKASRFITHFKRLKDPEEPIERLFGAVEGLGDKLGCVLFQLPPVFVADIARLRLLLAALPRCRCAFEFRNDSWFTPATYDVLADFNAALCWYDLQGRQAPRESTADFAYIRLHGPAEAYRGDYAPKTLRAWTETINECQARGMDVFCYFDNDEKAFAARDAVRLRELTAQTIDVGSKS